MRRVFNVASSWVEALICDDGVVEVKLRSGKSYSTPLGSVDQAQSVVESIVSSPSVGQAVSQFWKKVG